MKKQQKSNSVLKIVGMSIFFSAIYLFVMFSINSKKVPIEIENKIETVKEQKDTDSEQKTCLEQYLEQKHIRQEKDLGEHSRPSLESYKNIRKENREGNKSGAWVYAKIFIKNKLKAPSTADFGDGFGNIFNGDYQKFNERVQYKGNNIYIVNGWVDAKNSFGVKIRTRWLIEIKEKDDRWVVLDGPYLFE
jgi:hypothetical protein